MNVKRVEALIAAGRMGEPGLAAFDARNDARTGAYSFERAAADLPPAYAKAMRASKAAAAWFDAQPPWYRRTSINWIMDAKREVTRQKRLDTLIACSARGTPIPPLTRR